MTEGDSSPTQRPTRFLKVALTIACAQLLALGLLMARYGVGRSLGIAVGAGTLFLAWPMIWKAGGAIVSGVRQAVIAVTWRVLDRRTYRFGLRTLSFVVLVAAVVAGWYSHQQRLVSAERRRLDGKWQMLNRDGIPVKLPDGTPLMFELNTENYTVDPTGEPKQLDFHGPSGTSHAIYRWEGDDLVVMQVSPGMQRPKSFEQRAEDSRWLPGAARAAEGSWAIHRFGRMRE